MDFDRGSKRQQWELQTQDSVFSKKMKAGKRRTYYFDVRQTKGEDFYITITESTKRFNGEGFERHKIFLYKEDFNRFLTGLEEAVNHVKTELMPDYDYDEFTRKNEEYEASLAAEFAEKSEGIEHLEDRYDANKDEEEDDDMSW